MQSALNRKPMAQPIRTFDREQVRPQLIVLLLMKWIVRITVEKYEVDKRGYGSSFRTRRDTRHLTRTCETAST
jgi:hypothetical protein